MKTHPLQRLLVLASLLFVCLFLGACQSDPYYGGYRGGYYGPGPGYYGGGYYSRSYYRYPYRSGYYYRDHDHDHDRPSNGWNRPNNSGPNKPNWANNGGGNAQRPAAAPRGGSAPRATGPSRVGVRPPAGGGGGGGNDRRKKRN